MILIPDHLPKKSLLLISTFLLLQCIPLSSLGKPPATVKSSIDREESPDTRAESVILPYAFSTQSMGFNLGVGMIRSGFYQDQMTIGGTIFGGGSAAVAGGVWNYRLPWSDRWYFSAFGMKGDYPEMKAYAIPGDIFLPAGTPRPGQNDSGKDDFITAEGYNDWYDLKLEYVLPLGAARNNGWIDYTIRGGMLTSPASGGGEWNPLESGVTVLIFRQFNRKQGYADADQSIEINLHAFEAGILYDNTDFPANPSCGSTQYLSYTRDLPWKSGGDAWDYWEAGFSKYISLGSSSGARQRVLAFNAWTAYSPSFYYETNSLNERRVGGVPPFMEGASLGGFYRMRGYDMNRFHDKAAVYGTAEYRHTLNWNPAARIRLLDIFKIDWLQLVGFAEIGRVSEQYSSALFRDMKYDAGIGARIMAAGTVIRFDLAVSEEGANGWIMVSHPF